MVIDDKSWTLLGRREREFYIGLEKFVNHCKPLVNSVGKIRYPCKSCRTILRVSIKHLSDHITRHGFDLSYKTWVHHGEPALPPPPPVIDNIRQPQMSDMTALLNDLSYIPLNNEHNEPTQGDIGETSNEPTQATRNKFEELYASANAELYPKFFQNVFPISKGYKLAPSYKDLDFCLVCNTSRWKDSNTPGKKVPKKVLRYFPINPRLQCLYKSSHTAKEMMWHATGKCMEPGKMQHPVDGRAWKNFDTKYLDFAKEPRNVRLGLAADGFNLFGNLSQAYSMWSVILMTYNLPLWLCMKESSFMLTLLIPGPKSPGKDIDVYLRPLIEDLKVLWDRKGVETIDVASGQKFNMRAMVLWTINDFPARSNLSVWSGQGVETIDVASGQKFNMRAMVLWTINDFPARSSLSRWSGQGYKACPTCNKDTPFVRVLSKTAYVGHGRFLKKPHKWRSSREFNGQTDNRDPPKEFGRDEILDTIKARQDLKRLGIRSGLWLGQSKNEKCLKPQAAYSFTPENRKKFCQFIKGVKLPDGFRSCFKHKIRQRHIDNDKDPEVSTTSELFALACGPTWIPISINSCVVDGVRYVVHNRDERRITQNSSICSPGPDGEMYYGRKVKRLVFRNNMTQIDTRAKSFKDDQYVLVTQVKQVFYHEEKAKPYWRVVEHVNHKKFFDGGVIVVKEDPDIIHFDNSSDLSLSTSLNDLDNATLHIDSQSTKVDVPPYIIIDVVDEDGDITDDEDALPHDLAESDNNDLVNVDDDGVDKMSADVARSHDGDSGGEDLPLHTMYPAVAWVALLTEAKANGSPIWAAGPSLISGRTWNPPTRQRSTPASSSTCKKRTIPTRLLSRPSIGNIARAAQNRQNRAKSTVISRQGSRSLDRLRYEMEEMMRLEAMSTYIDDEINCLARGGKQRAHIASDDEDEDGDGDT
uniref:Transposase-associated domain-containing protein n=1 Tax=Tanacetum cinerariifolium TaxID=118510 RepID=A0A6L2MP33_TANCI|nr:hypothetical protein [Tanacetum cinerariifolium]